MDDGPALGPDQSNVLCGNGAAFGPAGRGLEPGIGDPAPDPAETGGEGLQGEVASVEKVAGHAATAAYSTAANMADKMAERAYAVAQS